MPVYRCYVCENEAGLPGVEFTAPAPAPKRPVCCPTCGEVYAKDAGHVALIEVIHYDPPKNARRGLGHAACDPRVKAHTAARVTAEPSAVTCPACRRTAVWGEQAGLRGVPLVVGEADFPLGGPPAERKDG